MELWGGAPNYIKKKFQHLQLEMARTVLGPKSWRWSKSSLLRAMGWINIDQLLAFTANKMTYKILHLKKPELLAYRVQNFSNINPVNTRLSGPYKMGPRPRQVGWTKLTKNQYRAKSYEFFSQIPDEIQKLSVFEHFTKWMKKFYLHNTKTPYDKLPVFV